MNLFDEIRLECWQGQLTRVLLLGASAPGRPGANLMEAYAWALRVSRFDDVGRYPGLVEDAEIKLGRPVTDEERELLNGWHPPRSWWRSGPWLAEPDLVEWRSKDAPDYPLVIVRGSVGALCGYVGVPTSHPLHGKGLNETHAPFCPSEGVTWTSRSGGLLVATGEPPDHWWFGFDCAHPHRQYCPALDAHEAWIQSIVGVPLPRLRRQASVSSYVGIDDCRRRTERLALTLAQPVGVAPRERWA